MKVSVNNKVVVDKLKLRIRLDFRAEEKQGRFLFGNKNCVDMAEEVREQQVYLMRNVPLQGISIEHFDDGLEIYKVLEEDKGRKKEVAYAPLVLDIQAESIEDVFPLLLNPEFRKIELLCPENVNINRQKLERMLYQISSLHTKEQRA